MSDQKRLLLIDASKTVKGSAPIAREPNSELRDATCCKGYNSHTVIPAIWRKWMRPVLTPAKQAGNLRILADQRTMQTKRFISTRDILTFVFFCRPFLYDDWIQPRPLREEITDELDLVHWFIHGTCIIAAI